MKFKAKEIDLKSFLIGFLLAALVFLGLAASPGTQDVRIVGVSTYDNLRVRVEKITPREIPVKVEDVSYDLKVPVEIVGVKYNLAIPTKIKNQPIEVKIR